MSKSKKTVSAKVISLSGLLLALTAITLYFATILPTNKLALYALSSFFVAVIVIETSKRNGWIFYGASCLLMLAIIPNKIALVPYVLFFGNYGIIKSYLEKGTKIKNIIVEYILKFAYFNSCLTVSIFFVKQLFLNEVQIKLPVYAIIIGLQIVFFIYDYVYTLFTEYYGSKLKKMLKI